MVEKVWKFLGVINLSMSTFLVTLLTDGIVAHSWKITHGRLPGSTLTVCLNEMFLLLKS